MSILLTVGITHYDDFHSAWQTLIGIFANHNSILEKCEFVVIDNNPGSRDGRALFRFVSRRMREWKCNSQYIPYTQKIGTAPVRNKLFETARGKFVLCLDSHIVFQNGVLERLVNYIESYPGTSDLLTGPIVMDDGNTIYTCQLRQWTSIHLGAWDSDKRGFNSEDYPFEVEQQGLGVFCMKREAWPGFNEELKGAGCVEPVLCQKIRNAGGKVLCLPFLRWHHRFGHYMKTVPYPSSNYDKMRNHLIAFQEVAWDTKPVIDHFRHYLEPQEWKLLEKEFSHLDFEEKKK